MKTLIESKSIVSDGSAYGADVKCIYTEVKFKRARHV